MKRSWKQFILVGLTVLLLASVASVGARTGNVQKNLLYNNINVSLDGAKLNLKDAQGNAVEPFMFDGTNYLPVRAVAEALGLSVDWVGATNTIVLTSPQPQLAGEVIMEQDGLRVTFLGFEVPSGYSTRLKIKLKIENNSTRNYGIQDRDLSVNGMMAANTSFSAEVAAGKTAIDSIEVYSPEESGIVAPYKTAEFKLHVFDPDSFKTLFDSAVISIS